MSTEGCRNGAKCKYFHPNVPRSEGKCFNCGSTSHSLKDCDRPRPQKRDPSKPPGKGKRGASQKPNQRPQGGKGGQGKGKDKPPQPQGASASAEPPAADGADAHERFCLRLKPQMKHLIDSVCVPCVANQSDPCVASANASQREPDFSYALLDSGATHVILNLSKLSTVGQREGCSI
eukprot:1334855-Amphidinium_carterae.1